MKNFEADEMLAKLGRASQVTEEFPVMTGYSIVYDIDLLEKKLKPYQKMVEVIIKKYAKPGENKISKDDPNFEKAKKEIEEIGREDIGDINLKKVKMEDIKDMKLKLSEIAGLSPILEV